VIELSKKQQWGITNYVVLVYGAIFGLSKYYFINPTPTLCEKRVLSLIALVAGVYALVLLALIQKNLGMYRGQLKAIYCHWLSDEERKLVLRPSPYPDLFRGGSFLAALVGVVIIGAGLLIYSLWRT